MLISNLRFVLKHNVLLRRSEIKDCFDGPWRTVLENCLCSRLAPRKGVTLRTQNGVPSWRRQVLSFKIFSAYFCKGRAGLLKLMENCEKYNLNFSRMLE